jgi:NDP-4-keto-2,6-dideoxyhexose 3-C-methyltransferase
MKCTGPGRCGLLQLAHSYSLDEMYGDNYGYRSGLNPSMVAHLRSKVRKIEALGVISPQAIVVDIGSNDGTTLKQYAVGTPTLVGIDPTARKFREFYGDAIQLIPEFFSAERYLRHSGGRKAAVVTSFAMFYDLEDPLEFMRQVANVLEDNGVWVFEQSYMPAMLATNSYDTVCHEHLEYYSLLQVLWMAEHAGLRIVDVELNEVNGGSFSVTAQKLSGQLKIAPSVAQIAQQEKSQQLDEVGTYVSFARRVQESREELRNFFERAVASHETVMGLGASTKGNVILQYCGITPALLSCVGEINPDKFGCYTPGTRIRIVNEEDVIRRNPDFVLVLPWHFRRHFESQPRYSSLRLVYPLPTLSGAADA